MNFQEIKTRLQKSSLFKDSFWALFGNSVAKVLALIVGITIANLLGSEDYGKYGLIKSTLLYLAVFSTFGLGLTGTKYIAQYKDQKREYINTICRDIHVISLITSGFIAVIVLIFAEKIALYMDIADMATAIRLSSIAVVFNALNAAQTGILSGFKKFRTISNYNMITGFYLCAAATLFTLLWGLNGTVIALGSSFVVNYYLNRYTLTKIRKEYEPVQQELSFKKEMVNFSLPLALQEGFQSLANWATIAVLIKLSDYSEYGIFSAAQQWTAAISFIPAILKNVTLSYLSDSKINHKRVVKIMLMVNLISSGAFFVAIFLCSGIIGSMYRESFDGLVSVLNILVFSSVLGTMGSVYVQELISSSKNWLSFSIFLAKSIIIIIIGCFLTMHEDMRGAISFASSTLIANVIYLTSLVITYKKYNK